MLIEVTTEIQVFSQPEFHALSAKLLRIIFDVHNEFGRFLDESLYKNEIAARWVEPGYGIAEREVQINVSHKTFRRSYFMDTLFNHGLLLEAKVAERLISRDRSQGLNYMFLTEIKHSLLANLRPERVEHEFLSTTLTSAERRRFSLVDMGWRAVNEESGRLREELRDLLADWGAFLDVNLYRDAMAHLVGGGERGVGTVPVYSGERLLGNQTVHYLTQDTAFAFTALPRNRESMEEHQRRFLKHTPLKFIQWVNFNRHNIEFTTLTK